jgi:hypothetical protein
MADVKGVVNSDNVNVRTGPKVIDPKSPLGPLKKGQDVFISGFALDPDGEEYRLRYRITLGGQTLWTTAKFVSIDPAFVKTIPFIPISPDKAAEELLESMGMDVKDGIEIPLEEAQEIASLLRDFTLTGTWDLDGILSLRTMIENLHDHGVTLGSADGGGWSINDLRKLHQAVEGMAQGIGIIFQRLYNKHDNVVAFRTMYAPLHIVRSGKNNVSPRPAQETWYAKNGNGYEIVLGNKVFFEGTQTTKSNRDLPYNCVELIAHEIGHAINWRYSLKTPNGNVVRPRQYYDPRDSDTSPYKPAKIALPSGETVTLNINDGYRFAARSSNGAHETVTDAITNFSLGGLTDDDTTSPVRKKQGEARRQQITDMLERIVKNRIENYNGVEGIQAAILKIGGGSLEASLQTALDLLKRTNANLDEQVGEFKRTGISAG